MANDISYSGTRQGTFMPNLVLFSPSEIFYQLSALETGKNANPCIFFLACFTTKMYVYCAYPAMSKSSSQLPNYNEQSRNKRRSYTFQEYVPGKSETNTTFNLCVAYVIYRRSHEIE
jgi:hypothetical protein